MLTQGELRNQIEYDETTGLWRWRVVQGNRKRNWFAGALISAGYLTIRVDGKTYYAHQLAWLYIHGEWIKNLDHKNRDKTCNIINNLRPADKSKNAVNAKLRSDNSSGHVGISKLRGKWQAYISCNGVRQTKLFENREEAISWYISKRKELFGEFVPQVVSLDSKQTA